ncbi:MAG TPA: hypothetical protein VGX69_02015 [Solirubrobacteraceae bacterium]|nr:hypothetical protein [Solirubrobacteraceae bacterium]
MNGRRVRQRPLLRFYPRWWRERYGEELEALLLQSGGGNRISWSARADVARAGLDERLRDWGVGGGVPAYERARGGALLVLVAWIAFAIAGARVQKLSEHWQALTPLVHRALAVGAFDALAIAAATGGVFVVAGIALVLPRALAYVREGGWPAVRRPLARAALASAATLIAFAALSAWAHHLSTPARNGADTAYTVAFTLFALLAATTLACWTALAVTIARALRLSVALLRVEALLACAVSATMLAMTLATALWWGALAHSAPWVLQGGPVGADRSPFSAWLFVSNSLMALATCLAAYGASRSTLAVRRLSGAAPHAG